MTTYAWFASSPDKAAHLVKCGISYLRATPHPLCALVTMPLKPVSRHAKLCARCLTLAARRGIPLPPTPLAAPRSVLDAPTRRTT